MTIKNAKDIEYGEKKGISEEMNPYRNLDVGGLDIEKERDENPEEAKSTRNERRRKRGLRK